MEKKLAIVLDGTQTLSRAIAVAATLFPSGKLRHSCAH
ncbi:hypothetical protein A2U01_0079429, partial [Trifolium medium]|nr:hypothetical protein [Trifolium medium]